jgi:hypothetical protein
VEFSVGSFIMALPEQVLASVDFQPIPRRHKVGVKHFTATVALPVINLLFLLKKNTNAFNRQYFAAATEKNDFGEFNSCLKLSTSKSIYSSLKVSREFVLNYINISVCLKES